jgi:hypothetical protein
MPEDLDENMDYRLMWEVRMWLLNVKHVLFFILFNAIIRPCEL